MSFLHSGVSSHQREEPLFFRHFLWSNKQTTSSTKSTMDFNSMFSRGERNNMSDEISKNVGEWELRPGGMLVQKRDSNNVNGNGNPRSASSFIKVKVKYGSSYHEIRVTSHASFGELKKMLTERTGLHCEDQKLIFKKKERDSKSYLDVERVKDGSKLVLVEDIVNRERRILESLRVAKKDKASKSLMEINHQVQKLINKVSALEEGAASSTGLISSELEIESLTATLMNILIKLDGIYAAEGQLKLQKTDQVRRVQKQIETLDMLKMKRSKSNSMQLKKQQGMNEGNSNKEAEQILPKQQQALEHSDSVVVTTKWETFD